MLLHVIRYNSKEFHLCNLLNIKLLVSTLFWVTMSVPLFPTEAIAKPSKCKTHAELIQISDADLEQITACNSLGAHYLLGLKAGRADDAEAFKTKVEGDWTYYEYVRFYLSEMSGGAKVWDSKAFTYLLIALSTLPDEEGKDDEIKFRTRHYAVYIMAEYWARNSETIELGARVLSEIMLGTVDGRYFKNNKEIGCFIKYDLPTLSVETIINSNKFIKCKGN